MATYPKDLKPGQKKSQNYYFRTNTTDQPPSFDQVEIWKYTN